MKRQFSIMLLLVLLVACNPGSKQETISAVDLKDVTFTDGFWYSRVQTNNTVTIKHNFEQCEITGRVDLFKFAAGLEEGVHSGYYFNDSDVYKNIEAAAYALETTPDPELEQYVDDLITLIGQAQEDDGYIYTAKTAFNEERPAPGGKERWSNIKDGHELYCAGHLYEAAVAHHKATGKRNLLDIALKNADLVCATFGPGKIEEPPGHQEVELGLFKLYLATGEEKYRDMALYFLDVRGTKLDERKSSGKYNQDHLPVREQTEVVGHAVRANYMFSAMADAAAISGDQSYMTALQRLWDNAMNGKLYITGGYGATGNGEAFGDNFELPNMSAYCETCSSIAGMMWNHRMFLQTGDAKYLDSVERTLYNAFLGAVQMDGTHFFYPNPLESVGQHQRSEWFNCACCPPNVARFIASLGRYFYATQGDRIYVNFYGANTSIIQLESTTVSLEQTTNYPWDGDIKITVSPEVDAQFELALRIPVWAQGHPVHTDIYRYMNAAEPSFEVKVNGEVQNARLQDGFVAINRNWKAGDVVELTLPMDIRRVIAREEIEADIGRVAIERGPLVYCVEWPDTTSGTVRNILLPDETGLTSEFDGSLLNGVQVINGEGVAYSYDDAGELKESPVSFRAIPYYAWSHRGRGEMQVWLARDKSVVDPQNAPTLASTSTVTASSGKGIEAVNDLHDPASSDDENYPYFHWWPNKGTKEWVQFDFPDEKEISQVEIYWFDDDPHGECRVPASWKVLYRDRGKWVAMYTEGGIFGVEKDTFNKVIFETAKTDAIRIEIQSQPDFASGIHEIKIK